MDLLYVIVAVVAGAALYKLFVADPARERADMLRDITAALTPQYAPEYDEDEVEDPLQAALEELLDSEDFMVPENWTISGGSVACGDEVLPALIFELQMENGEALGPFLVPFHEGGSEEFRTLVQDGIDEATRLAAEDQ